MKTEEQLLIGGAVVIGIGALLLHKDSVKSFIATVSGSGTGEIKKLASISGVSSLTTAGDFDLSDMSKKVAGKMKSAPMILLLGDYNYSNIHGAQYSDGWFNTLFGNYNGYLLAALGNHDIEEASSLISKLNLPGWSYSVDMGKLHLLVLNTESPVSGGAIDADLAAAKSKGKISVVAYHIPLAGHTPASKDYFWKVLPDWQKTFDKYKVPLVLQAHSHYYVRYKPTTAGTTYMIIGTGGATFNGLTPNSQMAKYYKTTNGYLKISISSSSLSCKFYDSTGVTKDSFSCTGACT